MIRHIQGVWGILSTLFIRVMSLGVVICKHV
jgi:hypothetical protein